MQDQNIYGPRIGKFMNALEGRCYGTRAPLAASFVYDAKAPIPYAVARKAAFQPIAVGRRWGELWGSAWFKFEGTVPKSFAGEEVVALLDIGGEGCVFAGGEPVQGLTGDRGRNTWVEGKHTVPLYRRAAGGERVSLLVEGAANHLFGAHGPKQFSLNRAELACLDRRWYRLELDLRVLFALAGALEENSPRRNRILRGLNDVANVWEDGRGLAAALRITAGLLSSPACASACTAWSIGHAHLDLGWLWPTRETRRKGGRTFSTALRLIEEYPEYRFGASQAQLYAWIRRDYPGLYRRVQKAVRAGRWECQGAMWVEPDMNLAGGEALVRQCLYGTRLFREDFGVEVNHLWLPDVFGYSAALPQILRKCGVDYFMTQKISWSETNTFPHHTFHWQGIDGTRILTHFLPTNDYNCDNQPQKLIAAEKRFAQNDVSGEFLNLYGIGDGGGGPSGAHIELGLRQRNLEGAPKFRFALARDFFARIARIPPERLPVWVGELYLELHRGTYTTQALMKKLNRQLELRLRDVEFLCAVAGLRPKAELDRIWEDTLLHQFHDILPGSSIGWVYREAHEDSRRHLAELEALRDRAAARLHGAARRGARCHAVYNTLSWDRTELVRVPAPRGSCVVTDGAGNVLPAQRRGGELEFRLTVPSMGYNTVLVRPGRPVRPSGPALRASPTLLENGLVRVRLGADGTLVSLRDKELDREMLAGPANELLLWEDDPRSWDAWDVSHYYRETRPQKARRLSVEVEHVSALGACVRQRFAVGHSTVEQRLELRPGSKCVWVHHVVQWNESHKMLRASARPAVHATEAAFEIQFGTLRRPTHANTSWDRARFEVCGHRFVDVSQADCGFALINDCKYGYYVRDGVLDLALLRSPKSPDENADVGEHAFTFGYLPHGGTLVESDVLRAAHELNSPLLVVAAARVPREPARSFYRVSGRNVKIETVKPAESGQGIVVRLYETAGSTARVRFEAAAGWRRWQETDLLERPTGRAAGPGTARELTFQPFEIRTFGLG